MQPFVALLALALASPAFATVTFTRTVDSLAKGSSGTLVFDHGCSSSDSYGSDGCSWEWGETIKGTLKGTLASAIDTGSQITVDATVDGLVKFNHSCAACGEPCTVTVPVIKKTFTIPMPSCPIQKGSLSKTLEIQLPKHALVPLKTTTKGTVTISDPSGVVLAKVNFSSVSEPPHAAAIAGFVADVQGLGPEACALFHCHKTVQDCVHDGHCKGILLCAKKCATASDPNACANKCIEDVPSPRSAAESALLGCLHNHHCFGGSIVVLADAMLDDIRRPTIVVSASKAFRGFSLRADGGCSNASDEAAWTKHSASFKDEMHKCGSPCLGMSGCMAKCVAKDWGVSSACATCFGDLGSCTRNNCMFKCATGSGKSASCAKCVRENCYAPFESCSGLTPP
jgi:hypothetical protein